MSELTVSSPVCVRRKPGVAMALDWVSLSCCVTRNPTPHCCRSSLPIPIAAPAFRPLRTVLSSGCANGTPIQFWIRRPISAADRVAMRSPCRVCRAVRSTGTCTDRCPFRFSDQRCGTGHSHARDWSTGTCSPFPRPANRCASAHRSIAAVCQRSRTEWDRVCFADALARIWIVFGFKNYLYCRRNVKSLPSDYTPSQQRRLRELCSWTLLAAFVSLGEPATYILL